jgi:hypothetical protein
MKTLAVRGMVTGILGEMPYTSVYRTMAHCRAYGRRRPDHAATYSGSAALRNFSRILGFRNFGVTMSIRD